MWKYDGTAGNHTDETEQTKGFHHTPRWRVEIHVSSSTVNRNFSLHHSQRNKITNISVLCCIAVFVLSLRKFQSKGESRSLTVRNMLQLLLWEVGIIGVTCLCTGELSLCDSPSCPEAQTRWPSELAGQTMTSDLAALSLMAYRRVWSSWPGPSGKVLSSVDACALLWWTLFEVFFQAQASYNVVASRLDLVSKVLERDYAQIYQKHSMLVHLLLYCFQE